MSVDRKAIPVVSERMGMDDGGAIHNMKVIEKIGTPEESQE